MMQQYKVQVDATEPHKWKTVTARDHQHAAATAAVIFAAPGQHTVYVNGPGDARHPNGTPLVVHGFTSRHDAKPQPVGGA